MSIYFAFANDSSVMKTTLIDAMYNLVYFNPSLNVLKRREITYSRILNSSKVFGSFPGAMSYTLAQTSGLLFTPMYWDFDVSLANPFYEFGIRICRSVHG